MKYFFLFCSLLLQIVAKAQLLYPYKDTVNSFYIGIPEKWKYWKTPGDPGVKLKVYDVNENTDTTKWTPDNFNINIVEQPGIDVEKAYYHLTNFTAQSRLQITDTGSYVVNGQKMLWFDDIRIGRIRKDTLHGSSFVVYDNNRAYVITCSSRPAHFPENRKLFHRIAQTFNTKVARPQESFKITFPTDRKWTIAYEADDSVMHILQVLPADESAAKWNTALTFVTAKTAQKGNFEKTLEALKAQMKKEAGSSRYALLSKGENWALIKVETNDPKQQEASLYYVLQGNPWLHMTNITAKLAELPADMINKWSDIFREGKLVVE